MVCGRDDDDDDDNEEVAGAVSGESSGACIELTLEVDFHQKTSFSLPSLFFLRSPDDFGVVPSRRLA